MGIRIRFLILSKLGILKGIYNNIPEKGVGIQSKLIVGKIDRSKDQTTLIQSILALRKFSMPDQARKKEKLYIFHPLTTTHL